MRLASVVVLLPAILVLVEEAAARTDVKVLLFPPLAAIGYRVFRHPGSAATGWRSVVLGPVVGSLCGLGLDAASGLRAWTVALAVLAGIAIIEVLRADAPPPLAIILLALFVGRPDWRYPLAVLAATALVFATFRAWRWGTRRWFEHRGGHGAPAGPPGPEVDPKWQGTWTGGRRDPGHEDG